MLVCFPMRSIVERLAYINQETPYTCGPTSIVAALTAIGVWPTKGIHHFIDDLTDIALSPTFRGRRNGMHFEDPLAVLAYRLQNQKEYMPFSVELLYASPGEDYTEKLKYATSEGRAAVICFSTSEYYHAVAAITHEYDRNGRLVFGIVDPLPHKPFHGRLWREAVESYAYEDPYMLVFKKTNAL